MYEKNTDELKKVLLSTRPDKIKDFIEKSPGNFADIDRPFAEYMREILNEKKLNRQNVFLDADIPERYGYKLISEQKRTRQRDIILRICYAANMSLNETQRALKLYGMPELYARIPRDAYLMIVFNERPGSIIDVNAFLKENGVDILRSSGVQE